MSIGRRITEARKAAKLSQAALGDLVGAVQTTVSSWERGRTEPTRDDVSRIAEALGIPLKALELADHGNNRPVPVIGYVGAGAETFLHSNGDNPNEYVEGPEDATEYTVGVEIRGQSLGPLFEHWIIYYDDVRSPVTPDLHGQLCVVGLADGRVLVKQVKPAATRDHFHLISNAADPPLLDMRVEWAAKVTSMRPKHIVI